MTSRWTVLLCVGSWGCGPAVADPPAATATTGPGTEGSTSGAGAVTSTSISSTTSTTSGGVTTTGDAPCASWCGSYPVNPGCDETYDPDGTSGGSGGGDDTGLGMGDDMPLATSVFAIQQGDVGEYAYVSVASVVATSPIVDAPVGEGSIFTVSDPAGGPYSGITVRVYSAPGALAIEPGDELTIAAEHRPNFIFSELHAYPEWITVTGAGVQPPPLTLDAATLLAFSQGSMDVKPYESVLVSLPPAEAEPGACAGELGLSIGEITVDDRFLQVIGESLPADPMLSGVRGPLLYTLNGFEIAPRSLADFAP